MPVGDGWTSELLAGLASYLATHGVGVWRPEDAYLPGEEPIILIRDIPPQPDKIITLATYPADDPNIRGLFDYSVGLQVRVRGTSDPRTCDDLADAVFDLIDSAVHVRWGDVSIVECYRQSYTSLGKDQNGRWERSENYLIYAMRPTSNRVN